jgi:hypothetical protein
MKRWLLVLGLVGMIGCENPDYRPRVVRLPHEELSSKYISCQFDGPAYDEEWVEPSTRKAGECHAMVHADGPDGPNGSPIIGLYNKGGVQLLETVQ